MDLYDERPKIIRLEIYKPDTLLGVTAVCFRRLLCMYDNNMPNHQTCIDDIRSTSQRNISLDDQIQVMKYQNKSLATPKPFSSLEWGERLRI